MTMARGGESVPHSPLTVKEQFEASATRFWSTVTSLNLEESTKRGCVESSATIPIDAERAVSIQSVLHAVFGSCTSGTTFEGQSKYVANQSNPITPSSSGGGRSTPEQRSPPDTSRTPSASTDGDNHHHVGKHLRSSSSSSKKKFFQDSHDEAEEAVLRLREHQLQYQQQQDVKQQHHKQQQQQQQQQQQGHIQQQTPPEQEQQSKRRIENDRKAKPDPPEGRRTSPFLRKALSRKKSRPISGIEHHAFFPASNPQTTKLHPSSKPAVPKEVASPSRKPRGKASKALPMVPSPPLRDLVPSKTLPGDKEDNDGSSYFDFEDDGVSVITQETVDEMIHALEQEQVLFPDAPILNRVHSDVTDRIDASFADWRDTLNLSAMSGAANTSLDLMIEGLTLHEQQEDFSDYCAADRASSRIAAGMMGPPILTREGRSSGTRSFFTRTTHSTQTEDFACTWMRDEQQYWDTLVREESDPGVPTRHSKMRRIREKVKVDLFGRNAGRIPHHQQQHPTNKGTITSVGNSRTTAGTTVTGGGGGDFVHSGSSDNEEVYRAVHDRLMDAMIHQSEDGMAEI